MALFVCRKLILQTRMHSYMSDFWSGPLSTSIRHVCELHIKKSEVLHRNGLKLKYKYDLKLIFQRSSCDKASDRQ